LLLARSSVEIVFVKLGQNYFENGVTQLHIDLITDFIFNVSQQLIYQGVSLDSCANIQNSIIYGQLFVFLSAIFLTAGKISTIYSFI